MKLELSHDLLAREIYDSITRSAPELVQLKQKEQYIQAQYTYYLEQNRSLLTREELEGLLPFMELLVINDEERKFVADSQQLIQRKRMIRILSIALISLLLVIMTSAFLYYAYQARLNEVRADEAAAYSETIRLSNLSQQESERGNRDNALLLASYGAGMSKKTPPLIQHALSDAFHLGFQLIPLLIAKPSHEGTIKQVDFSPNDSSILSVGEDKTARLWNMEGQLLANLQHENQTIHDAIFSPDSKQIFTCAQNGSIKIWDAGGKFLNRIDYGSEVIELAASTDHILAMGFDQSVKVFTQNGDVVLENSPPEGFSWWAIQFSPTGDQILFASDNGDLRLSDLRGTTIRSGRFSDSVDKNRYSFIFLEDGSIRIASPQAAGWIWRTDGQIRSLHAASSLPSPVEPQTFNILQEQKRLLNPRWGTPLPEAIYLKHPIPNPSASFSPSGQYIISFNRNSPVFFVWSLNSAPIQQTQLARPADLTGYTFAVPDSLSHTLSIDWAKWSPSGNRLFTTSSYRSKLWSADCSLLAEWDALSGLQAVHFSNDGALLWIIYALRNGTAGLAVRDSMGREVLNLTFPNDVINQVLPVPNTAQLIILLNSGRLVEYSLPLQQIIQQKELASSPTTGVFTLKGDQLFLGFGNGWVKQWDRTTDSISELTQHSNNVFDLDIQEENELIVSASGDGSARLSTFTGKRIKEFRTNGFVLNARFSPSGSHFFIRDQNNLIQLFSTDGRDSLVLGSVNPIEEALFSSNGEQLLLLEKVGSKSQLRLVDLSGQTLAVYTHFSSIVSMAISPDGFRVYSFEVATARTWLTPLGILDWLGSHTLAPFSPQEEKLYMLDR